MRVNEVVIKHPKESFVIQIMISHGDSGIDTRYYRETYNHLDDIIGSATSDINRATVFHDKQFVIDLVPELKERAQKTIARAKRIVTFKNPNKDLHYEVYIKPKRIKSDQVYESLASQQQIPTYAIKIIKTSEHGMETHYYLKNPEVAVRDAESLMDICTFENESPTLFYGLNAKPAVIEKAKEIQQWCRKRKQYLETLGATHVEFFVKPVVWKRNANK